MVQHWCLNIFFELRNSTSHRPLPMMSFFLHRYFEHGQTDWDSQYSSWEVYCVTTALDGYPSHSDKIHYIQMVTSVYICGITFYKPCQSSLPSSSLFPSTFYFWPIFASI